MPFRPVKQFTLREGARVDLAPPRGGSIQAAGVLRFLDRVARRRWVVVPVLSAAMAVYTGANSPADIKMFSSLGRAILGGHLARAYSTGWNQSGPLQLIVAALVPPGSFHPHALLRFEIVMAVLLALAAMILVRSLRVHFVLPASPGHELAAGLVVAVWVIGGYGLVAHLAELTIPVAWVLAGAAARRGHWALAGALLALAAAIEPWGALGMPVTLLTEKPSEAARACGLAIVLGVACYLPFVLSGSFEMFSHRWPIVDTTFVHALWPNATSVGWLPRILQAALCITAGCVLARVLRRRPNAIWLVPLAILYIRLILDPLQYSYYWVAPQMALVAGIAFVDVAHRTRTAVVVGLLWLCSTDFGEFETYATVGELGIVLAIAWFECRPGTRRDAVEQRPHFPTKSARPGLRPLANRAFTSRG